MILRPHFFLVSMFCGTAFMAPAPILSTETSAFYPFVCTLQLGVAMNWGYVISAAARSPLRADEVKNLPSTFSLSLRSTPERGFFFGIMMSVIYASLPAEYEPLFCCTKRFGLAGLPLFCGGHYIAYSLTKWALQRQIDRSYRNVPTHQTTPQTPHNDLNTIRAETVRSTLDSQRTARQQEESSHSGTSSQRSEEDQASNQSETSDTDLDLPSHSHDDYGMTENYETGHYTARMHNLRKLCIHSTRDF